MLTFPQMPKSPSFESLKALYQAAREAGQLKPWNFMEEEEIFALRPEPDGETYYACILGAAGISRDIIFYRGIQGWTARSRIRDGTLEAADSIQVLDALTVGFDPWNKVEPDGKKRLKRVGLGPGQGPLPVPRSFVPGRQPAQPDALEVESLTRLLRLSLPVLRRSSHDPGWLLERAGAEIFHVEEGGNPDHPAGQWLAPPVPQSVFPEAAPPDELQLARVTRRKLRAGGVWEVEAGDSGAAVRDEGGAFRPLVAVFVDSASGFVTGFALAPATEMREKAPREFLNAAQTHGVLPKALHVRRDDVAVWLAPTADKLEIPLIRRDHLPAAAEALGALREHMTTGKMRR